MRSLKISAHTPKVEHCAFDSAPFARNTGGTSFSGHSRCMDEPHKLFLLGSIPRPAIHYPKPKGLGSNGEERRKRNGNSYTGLAAPCLRSRRLPVERKSGRGTYTPYPFEAFKTRYESCVDSRQVPSPTQFPDRWSGNPGLPARTHRGSHPALSYSHGCLGSVFNS